MEYDIYRFISEYLADPTACARVLFLVLEDEQSYPLLFFSRIVSRLSAAIPVMRLAVDAMPAQDIYRELETTFLGQERLIWLQGYTNLSERDAAHWSSYIQAYTGPHRIIMVMHAVPSGSADWCKIPAMVHKRECTLLYRFLAQRDLLPHELERLQDLFVQHEKIDLDMACMLYWYTQLLGRDTREFNQDWLVRLGTSHSSLFSLSQHLFARALAPFMQQWAAMQSAYSEQFWIAYWSEQFWRASWYAFYMQHKQIAQAKKMGFRLPYSFLQKDYRHYKAETLASYVSQLYAIDTALKRGGSSGTLDLFFYRFFAA